MTVFVRLLHILYRAVQKIISLAVYANLQGHIAK
jgi:hypothetical protein